MAIRMFRFMTGRSINADAAGVGFVVPIYRGEVLRKLYVDCKAVSRGTGFGGIAGTPSSFPDQMNELNWHVLSIPWDIWVTNSGANQWSDIDDPDTATEIDRVFKNLLFEWSADGNEYYGGDTEADKVEVNRDDLAPDTTDSSASGTEATALATSVAERGSMGPLGIVRILGREIWADNMVSDGDGKVRQGDQWTGETAVSIPGPTMIVGGVIRYEHAAETNFGVEINTSSRKQARNMLIGGDLSRVQAHIEKDSGTVGDYIRTMLFGGDAYIEADTVKGEAMKHYWKGVATVDTPYSLQRF